MKKIIATGTLLLVVGTFLGVGQKAAAAPTMKKKWVEQVAPPASRVTESVKIYAKYEITAHGWPKAQWQCLNKLWTKESNWRHLAKNRSSGAYGIPQALPAEKMASAGKDWKTNPFTQVDWGLKYIISRYKTPCGAIGHWNLKGWY